MPQHEPAPRVAKLAVVERALSMMVTRTDTIIETGTGHGDLACLLRNVFNRVVTIELSASFVEVRKRLYGTLPKVQTLVGDSRECLPALARDIREPAVWYLDAHYCHLRSLPADGDDDVPLMEELAIISARPQADAVIVDDVHAFNRVRTRGHPGGGWTGVSTASIIKRLGRVRASYNDNGCLVLIRTCET